MKDLHYLCVVINKNQPALIIGSKQPFAIYFLLTTCNVCPVVIPEIFTQIQGSDYWPLIH